MVSSSGCAKTASSVFCCPFFCLAFFCCAAFCCAVAPSGSRHSRRTAAAIRRCLDEDITTLSSVSAARGRCLRVCRQSFGYVTPADEHELFVLQEVAELFALHGFHVELAPRSAPVWMVRGC